MPYLAPASPADRARKTIERDARFFAAWHNSITEQEAFLAGDRYENDNGEFERDRRVLQIKGQEIQDVHRHVVAKVWAKQRNIEARPVDRIEDPTASEIAVGMLELRLNNPLLGWDRERYNALMSCRQHGVGAVWIDWVSTLGPYGEIIFGWQDLRGLTWDPQYAPHHPLSDHLTRVKRMHVDEAREVYSAPWLEPDRGAFTGNGSIRSTSLVRGALNGLPIYGSFPGDDECVSLVECWYKNDRTYGKKKAADSLPITDPAERYMVCAPGGATDMGCGYRSPKLRELANLGMKGAYPKRLPEAMPGACPTCGGDLHRVDARDVEESALVYARGRRLIVSALYQQSPDDDPLADGSWPVPECRSYPLYITTAYSEGGKLWGPSDTVLMWYQQLAADNLRTAMVQQVLEHRRYWLMPGSGIEDYRGNRFEFREDQFNVMYRNMASQQDLTGPLSVESINASAVDSNGAQVFQIVQDALTRYAPKFDIGPADNNTRDIAVGTIERQVAEAETATEDFVKRDNLALGIAYGVIWDMERATSTPSRLARLRIDGIEVGGYLSGDDLPGMDFTLSESPQFTGLDKRRGDAFKGMLDVALNPQTRPFLDLYAEENNLPPSTVRKMKAQLQEMEQEQQQADQMNAETDAMMGGGAGAPNGEGAAPAPGANPPPADSGMLDQGMLAGAGAGMNGNGGMQGG